jgi:hypothetical protein
MDTIDSWIVPITQNLIAALIGAACARFAAAKRESIHKVMGVAASAGKKMMPMTVRVVLDAAGIRPTGEADLVLRFGQVSLSVALPADMAAKLAQHLAIAVTPGPQGLQ